MRFLFLFPILRSPAFEYVARFWGNNNNNDDKDRGESEAEDYMAERGGFEPPVPVLASTTV